MNVNVCVHAHLLKPVCVCVCVYLVEFYFCEIPFQLFSRIHLYLHAKLGFPGYNPRHSEFGIPLGFLVAFSRAEIVEGREDTDVLYIS